MESSNNYSDIFENLSRVACSSRALNFDDDTLSTMSAFQPAICSTVAKISNNWSNHESPRCNRYRLSASLLSTRDEDQVPDDRSSLGLLHSDEFKSIPRSGHDFSFPWNASLRQEAPCFSEDFASRDIQDNLEFIEREEARNQVEHRFIPEEIIDYKGSCETSSWSVPRGLEPVNEEPAQTPQSSHDSTFSASLYFQKHSGPLGEVNGSVLDGTLRPAFGTVVQKKINRQVKSGSPSGQGETKTTLIHSFNGHMATLSSKNSDYDAIAELFSSANIGSSVNEKDALHSKERSQRSVKSQSERSGTSENDSKRRPMIRKGEASLPTSNHVCKDQTSIMAENSSFGTPEGNSFWSLTRIQAAVADASVSGNASLLSKQILTVYEKEKRKKKTSHRHTRQKDHQKEMEKEKENMRDLRQKETGKVHIESGSNRGSKEKAVLEEEGKTGPSEKRIGDSRTVHSHITETLPPNSIPVEMKVGNIIYKGVLYPENLPTNGHITL